MVTKNKVGNANGIRFTKPDSQTRPPFEGREEEEELRQPLPPREEIGAEERLKAGKVPLHPAMVRLPLRAEGSILELWTGWEGWLYDEATLNDLGEMAQQLDIMLSPAMQFAIALVAVHAVKTIGFYNWVRTGKPQPHKVGEGEEEE